MAGNLAAPPQGSLAEGLGFAGFRGGLPLFSKRPVKLVAGVAFLQNKSDILLAPQNPQNKRISKRV